MKRRYMTFLCLLGLLLLSAVEGEEGDKKAEEKPIVIGGEDIIEEEEIFPVPKIIEPEMVLVKGGNFIRGSKEDDKTAEICETPQAQVYVKDFYIDKYEVTNAMYKKFVDETSYKPPRHWIEGEIPVGKENHPVVYVTWDDASAYAKWAGKRLPTEAEWEKSARGTDGRVFPWGAKELKEFDKLKCRNILSNIRNTTEVNDYGEGDNDGKSPAGCFNMSGNVAEWVADRYDWRYYRRKATADNDPNNNPTGPADSEVDKDNNLSFPYRTVRGGSWGDRAEDLRCAKRSSYPPDYQSFRIGFRCAKDAK